MILFSGGGDIKYIPYIICLISYAFVTLIAILPSLTFGKRLNEFGKIFLFFTILLLPMGITSTEILGRFLQLQFYVWCMTFCLLIYRYDNKEKRKFLIMLTDILLLLAIATLPSVLILIFAYILIEIYQILKKYFNKTKGFSIKNFKTMVTNELKKYSIYQFIIFCLLVLILSIIILIKMHNCPDILFPDGDIKNWLEFMIRSLSYTLIWPFYEQLNNVSGSIILIFTLIFYIGGIFFINKKSRKLYILSLISLFTITIIVFLTRFHLTINFHNFEMRYIPDRYYIPMNLASLISIAIIISDGLKLKTKRIFSCLIIVYIFGITIINGKEIFQYDKNYLTGLYTIPFYERLQESYYNNILTDDKDNYKVKIDPDAGWFFVEVPAKRMQKSFK